MGEGSVAKTKSTATAVRNVTNLIGAVAIPHGVWEIGSTGIPVMPEIGESFFFDIRGLPHRVLAKYFFDGRARPAGITILVRDAFGGRFVGIAHGGGVIYRVVWSWNPFGLHDKIAQWAVVTVPTHRA